MIKKLQNFLFGEPVRSTIPARVRQEIEARQGESERLISWVQFVLIVLFGVLWLLSLRVNMNATEFQVVPLALSAYFVFTVTRLLLSYRMSLPHWLLTLLVFMDVALLMLMIWSFHIQYEQPPSFYLKAPTIMYVFIFIAMRALRFEPRYIMIAGMTSIVGWLVLVGWVIYSEPGNPMITRDYIAYMTSNSILIGAEIDKMVSIFLVTAVLCIAVIWSRRAFFRAVIEQSAAQDLSRFVSKEVAVRITSADRQIQAGDGESRVASIIFTDIEGFSSVSENMTAQELAKTLNDYFGTMGEIIDQFGGVITLFEGDLMLITFNAVQDDPDHAQNAVQTALAIEKAARTQMFNGVMLKTRCGINTGEITVGAVGAQNRLVFTVHGDSVNIAARLEQLKKEYGTYIMMGEATHLAIDTDYPCEFIYETQVKGRAQAVKVYAPTINS